MCRRCKLLVALTSELFESCMSEDGNLLQQYYIIKKVGTADIKGNRISWELLKKRWSFHRLTLCVINGLVENRVETKTFTIDPQTNHLLSGQSVRSLNSGDWVQSELQLFRQLPYFKFASQRQLPVSDKGLSRRSWSNGDLYVGVNIYFV